MQDLEALNIPTDAYIFPRATDHIREQIGLIATLEIEGYTYRTSDGIYFDTSRNRLEQIFSKPLV
jgi:cysteinyl-tRNA synthetase